MTTQYRQWQWCGEAVEVVEAADAARGSIVPSPTALPQQNLWPGRGHGALWIMIIYK